MPDLEARLGLLLAGLACAAGPAQAFGNLLLIESPPAAATLAVGPALWVLPKYPGSRSGTAAIIPGVDFYAPSGFFASTDSGLGWNLSKRRDVQAGLRLWPQFGRSAADAPAGISAIGHRLQAQAFFNFAPLPEVLLQSALLRGAGQHHDGMVAEWGATSGVPLGADLLAIGLAASFANRAWRQSYFGVSASEAVRSGLAQFGPGAGWQDVSLSFSTEHHFTPQWHLSGQLTFARLLGGAARSPLAGSARQTGASVTLWRDL